MYIFVEDEIGEQYVVIGNSFNDCMKQWAESYDESPDFEKVRVFSGTEKIVKYLVEDKKVPAPKPETKKPTGKK